MNIVIIGRFSPPILSCMRSWGRQGYKTGLICIDDGCGLIPRSRFLYKSVRLSPHRLYQDQGILEISSFLKEFDADVLTCVDDNIACWLNDNIRHFEKKLLIALPSSLTIKTILSKTWQNNLALQAGFKVLTEYIIDNLNHEILKIDSNQFPLCIRPSEPGHIEPHFKVNLVQSSDELVKFIKNLSIEKEGKIIGQPFKNLPNLVIHGIRTKDGDVKYLYPFIVERKLEGVTLTLRPFPGINSDLLDKCRQFVCSAELTGTFHFEFLFDEKTQEAFFLEINLRFGGTTAKVAACGYDEPIYALAAYGIGKDCRPPEIKYRTVSNKQALLKYMGKAIFKKLTPLDYPEGSMTEKIVSAVKGLFFFHDEVLSLGDVKGSFNLYMNNIFQILLGLLGKK